MNIRQCQNALDLKIHTIKQQQQQQQQKTQPRAMFILYAMGIYPPPPLGTWRIQYEC